MHNTTEVPSGMSNQQFAYELLHTRGLIQTINGEEHWAFDSPDFISDSHQLRVLYLQAHSHIDHISACDLQKELDYLDPDLLLPAPWKTETMLWVNTFYQLIRGGIDIIDGYTILQENMISRQTHRNFDIIY